MKLFCRLASILLLLAAFLQSAVNAADQPTKPDLVFLLIGQSNMAGRAALEKGDEKPIANVLLLDDKGQWIPAANPLNRFATDRKDLSMQRISPGAGFAHEMSAKLPGKTIGLISNARGGSSIQQWGKGQALYVHAMTRLSKVKGLRIDGVLWHQGESNRNDADYLERLTELILRLRTELKNDDLPFVAGEIYGEGTVNAHMQQMVETIPHTGLARANGLTVFDKVHFDRKSQLTLGQRYATEMLRLLDSNRQ
ncbi:MAG: sialate O-acetylesterase [Rhodopirellula sp.]|nr:sialate O-acetylesterase [Rhodopirellula sp.]